MDPLHADSPVEELIADVGESAPETAPPPQTDPSYAIKYRDKEETYPLQKILEFANQGRDYSQKMLELKTQRDQFEKQFPKDLTERLNRYTEIESFIKTNPAWWDHLNQQWQSRDQPAGGQATGAPPLDHPVLKDLMQTVNGLKEKADLAEQERQLALQKQEDEQLSASISEYQEKYPQFDWKTVDEKGLDLEKRIVDYAIQNGIRTFKAAANDYLHDEHLKRAMTSAREDVGKSIQKNTKLGLGPITHGKTLGAKPTVNVSRSWEEITAEALASIS